MNPNQMSEPANSRPETNTYFLANFKMETPNDMQSIVFYKKNVDGTEEKGTTLEEVLNVSISRLKDLNNRFGCRENSIAITKMEEALMWLNKRTQDRIDRGVEGKHVV